MVSVAASVLALVLSVVLAPLLEPTRFLLLPPAVIAAAWYGGFGPGLLSAAITSVGATVLLVPPVGSFELADPAAYFRLAVFVLTAGAIAGFTETERRARRRAERARAAARAASDELRNQRLRTELVLSAVRDGITVQDTTGKLVFANEAAARMLGLADGEELSAMSPADVHARFEVLDESGDPLPVDELPGRRALRGERAAERLVRYRRRLGGVEGWLLVRSAPVVAGGEVLYAVNVFHDLTERMEDARRLQQAAEEAAAASAAKSRFLAVMSHELRTPLNAILGYEQLLEEGIVGPVTEKQREQLGRIRTSTHHLLGLIEQILSLSRVEAGREVLRLKTVDVSELARDTAALVAPLAQGSGIDLRVQAGDDPLPLTTDPEKLRQILLNLLSNAIKFTPRGGTVGLDLVPEGEGVAIEVRDTGVGIAPEDLEHIFEPFVQGTLRDGPAQTGTGLGLAVSRELARVLGGDIQVTSEPGLGSTFRVTLPREHHLPG